jgi:hypothetical protein
MIFHSRKPKRITQRVNGETESYYMNLQSGMFRISEHEMMSDLNVYQDIGVEITAEAQ